MSKYSKEIIEKHIKTHTERSSDDYSAVSTLQAFLKSDGKINVNFAYNDKWPNIDGTFEYVSEPILSRRPKQNFVVQIKGTHLYTESDGVVKYTLKSLAFPAYIMSNVTLDPGILFVVLNADCREAERVFWKYMSVEFLESINFENGSMTVSFSKEEEILNTNESIKQFCAKLEDIVEQHSFVRKLDNWNYSKNDVIKIIEACNTDITESLDRMDILNETRDNVSRRMLTRLYDLCAATLLLNVIEGGVGKASLQLAWERAILNIETKYLGTFLKGLQYLGRRIPDSGQSERLMLKYYNFLWQIRKFLKEKKGMYILHNLEKFPLRVDELDHHFYELVSKAVEGIDCSKNTWGITRFYIQKKTPFFVEGERYYEVTLQMTSVYATKYNRITIYTKENISTNYPIQICSVDTKIELWGIETKVKVITGWRVSISSPCLNKLAKVLNMRTNLSMKYGEYNALMIFLTKTGINLLDLIDLQEDVFHKVINSIYKDTNTSTYKYVLLKLRETCSKFSKVRGSNVIRYLLLALREEYLEGVMPTKYDKLLCDEFYIARRCFPFDKNPLLSDLSGHKTSGTSQTKQILGIVGNDDITPFYPYLYIKSLLERTGEIYFEEDSVLNQETINKYNLQLDQWETKQGYGIKTQNGLFCIESYEKCTLHILKKLLEFTECENKGQKEYNQVFLKQSGIKFEDPIKEKAMQEVFVNSQLLLIYGAAGTGKTLLIDYISDMMGSRSKLFFTKTHTALQSLKRRIKNPGVQSRFASIDSFAKSTDLSYYDIIFVDECSTIDNRTMEAFLNKVSSNTFLVLAGDIHQIESIEFGNWFFYAKDIVTTQGANVELLSTWRTKEQALISLWNEVRERNELITEKLAIDGPFSEDIGRSVFEQNEDREVVLCLNYDGKFGLNSMNNYFQNANDRGEFVTWHEWSYKVGDPILFNETKRFPILYNNLKGRIVAIKKAIDKITFTVDVEITLTERDCKKNGIEFVDMTDEGTRICFSVYAYDETVLDEESRVETVIPFQLAYAVSIHKAQGLEYDSVKVIIPGNMAEKITHGVFYTAITRAKKKLKIYWSSETMEQIIKGFYEEKTENRSLEIIKSKL